MTRALWLNGELAEALTYGHVDLDRWLALHQTGVHLHCFLDGVDVTVRTCAANDVEGWVDLYAVNAQGEKYRDPDKPGYAKREIVRGTVRLESVVHVGPCSTVVPTPRGRRGVVYR